MILNTCNFYQVDAVPFLVEHTHRTTAKLLLNMNGLVMKILLIHIVYDLKK